MNDAIARDRLAGTLLGVLVDSSNFPERARARLLGQDMRPLSEKCATAIIAAGWRPPVRGVMNLDEYIRQSETDGNLFWRLDSGDIQNLLDEAIELIEALRAVINTHPNPLECGKHSDDDPVSCGWKLTYTQIVQEIGGRK